VYPYVVACVKTVREVEGTRESPPVLSEPSDTPGVAILDLAQQYVSTQGLAIQIEHSMFEAWVRTSLVSIDEIYKTLSWEPIVEDGKVVSLAEVKDCYKRYFELLI
jgi:hypothetical protein